MRTALSYFSISRFFSEKQYWHKISTISQSVSYNEVTSSANVYEKNSEIEYVNAQSTEFQKTFDVIKQIEKLTEP